MCLYCKWNAFSEGHSIRLLIGFLEKILGFGTFRTVI